MSTKDYINIKKTDVLFGVVIAVALLAGYFVSYFTTTIQASQAGEVKGYQRGYGEGYANATIDIYNFNYKENLQPINQIPGLGIKINDTDIRFEFFGNDNKTYSIPFKTSRPLDDNINSGKLIIFSSPLKIPEQLQNALKITPQQFYLFESAEGIRYTLKPA